MDRGRVNDRKVSLYGLEYRLAVLWNGGVRACDRQPDPRVHRENKGLGGTAAGKLVVRRGRDFVGLSSGCKLGAARRYGRHTGCGPDDGGDLYGCPADRDRAESARFGRDAAQESGVNCPGGAGKILLFFDLSGFSIGKPLHYEKKR